MPDGRGGRLAVALAAGLALLAGAARAETVLRARLNADILSTNPGVRRDENTDMVLQHVVEGLVAYREDTSIGPLLADRWEVSPDGRTYVFHLRQGVTFHNGAPLTSAEAVWSLRRYLDPKTHWRCARELSGGGFAKIVGVEAADPQTVRVTLDKPFAGFLSTLARVDCGGTAILHPSSVGPDGAWRAPVGTGPFRIAGWKHNQYVDLARFAGYRPRPGPRDGHTGGKPALVDRVRFLVIPDPVAAEAALLRGDLDVLDNLTPIEARQLAKRRDVRLDTRAGFDVFAILFETHDPLLADPRLRQAIALTLDLPGLTRAVTAGTGRANRSVVPVGSPFHDAVQAEVPKPNLAEARRLAKAAGYRGQTITLITNHRYPAMFDGAVLVQAMAMQAGINVRLETLDWAAELDRYNTGRYQAMSFSYSARMDPSLGYDALTGDKAADPRKVWDDPQARALLAQSRASADPAQRQAAFDQLHALFMRDVPAIVIFNPPRIAALAANVTGYQGWAAGPQRLWGVSLR
jgi:peptide/nickel transport system substrate-binding protein